MRIKRSDFTGTLVDCSFSLINGLITAMKVAFGMVGLMFLDDSLTYIPRRLPMARVWPPSRFGFPSYPLSQQSIDLPPQDTQDSLLELYFTNIHPTFPVLHKTRFLTEYNARKKNDGRDLKESPKSSASPVPEPTQEVTPLLLLSIFAIAARYTDDDLPNPSDNMWEAGYEYANSARDVLG